MTESDLDRRIRELLDREAILELASRYCHCVRRRDLDGVLDLFAEDSVLDAPAAMLEGGAQKGRAALAQGFRAGMERFEPWPLAHNHVVELLGPESSRGFVYIELRMATEQYRTTHIMAYEDGYVKEGGRWKFRVRKLTSTAIPAT